MCTTILLYNQLDGIPIILAQNRDSLKTNEELCPAKVNDSTIILAPLDKNSNGTWIGLNKYNLLLALSNAYQPDRESYQTTMSRGKLVLDALKNCKTPKEAIDFVYKQTREQKLKFFNLFCISPEMGFFIEYRNKFESRVLPTKTILFHYSSGYDKGIVKEKRKKRLNQLFKGFEPKTLDNSLGKIEQVCRDHFEENNPSEDSICMHGSPRRTISSIVFVVTSRFSDSFCRYLRGYPCEEEYKNFFIGGTK